MRYIDWHHGSSYGPWLTHGCVMLVNRGSYMGQPRVIKWVMFVSLYGSTTCHVSHVCVNRGSYMGRMGQPWVIYESHMAQPWVQWVMYGSTKGHTWVMRVTHGSMGRIWVNNGSCWSYKMDPGYGGPWLWRAGTGSERHVGLYSLQRYPHKVLEMKQSELSSYRMPTLH